MEVLKNNYNKKIKVICANCKSKIKAKRSEFKELYGCYYIECPICKERIYKKEK